MTYTSSVHPVPVPPSWETPAPRRRRRRRRRVLPAAVLSGALFVSGFFLGRTTWAAPSGLGGLGGPNPAGAVPSAPAIVSAPGVLTGAGEGAVVSTPPQQDRPWNLLLVNFDHPLERSFSVPQLTELRNGQKIDKRAYPALQSMMDACRAAGHSPVISSSYRTWEKQQSLYDRKVRSYLDQGLSQTRAEEQAATWVARPGTSEHQVGLAVDIVDLNYQQMDEGQERTAVQQWLIAHCAEYGFILRYPSAKKDLTGVNYEPWHYRYVGVEAAEEMTRRGICLEEYLAQGN